MPVGPAQHTAVVEPWKHYQLHLVVAVLAVLGGASGLDDATSPLGALFWWSCLAGGLLNAVVFGVGWERRRAALVVPADSSRS